MCEWCKTVKVSRSFSICSMCRTEWIWSRRKGFITNERYNGDIESYHTNHKIIKCKKYDRCL